MNSLIVLSLVFVFVLVGTLAAGLIAILYYLNHARVNLHETVQALRKTNRNVDPLEKVLTGTNEELARLLENLRAGEENLSHLPTDEMDETREKGA